MKFLYSSLLILSSSFAFAQTWEPVGGGIQGGDSNICVPVFSLCEYNGKLYAAGLITKAGNLPVNNIASWDGKKWDTLGKGLITGPVTTLTVYKNELCAGGLIYKAGGKRVNNVAHWEDTARTIPFWHRLGMGIGKISINSNNSTASVLALKEYDGELYAAGGFKQVCEGYDCDGIARLVEKNWLRMPFITPPVSNDSGGGTGWNARGTALTIYNKELYLAYLSWEGVDEVGIAAWNGKKWFKESKCFGVSGFTVINTLLVNDSTLYAGGAFYGVNKVSAYNIAMWDGKSWSALGKGTHGNVFALAYYNGKLYVGGNFDSAGGVPAKNVAAWNGKEWESVGEGLEGTYKGKLPQVSSLCVYKGELYAAGYFNSSNSKPVNHIAKLNLKGTKPTTTNSKK